MKKILGIIIFILSFSIVKADDCGALLTYEAASFIGDIVTLVRIAVPILLVVLCSADFVSIVTGQEEDITKKAISRIVKRFICAAAFFFVPLIIQLILGIDAVNNALNLVDDPSCGIGYDSDDELKDKYKSEEDIQEETNERLEEEKKKEEEEKKNSSNALKNSEIYKKESYHDNSVNGVRYILYNQMDSRWKDLTYYDGTTMGAAGCHNASVAVVASAHDYNITPKEVFKNSSTLDMNKMVDKMAPGSFNCETIDYKSTDAIKSALSKGAVVIVKVFGNQKYGESKFASTQHYMALIDYKNGQIFVGNSYSNATYGKSGWFAEEEVLKSVRSANACMPTQSLIDRFNKKTENEQEEDVTVEIKCDKKGTYKEETYCAPNSSYRFGKMTQLDACSWNYVQHDSYFPEGTKVYAAIDGKAEFIQSACGELLTGYGNYVKITGSSGTYVLYGHLSKFVEGVDMPLTKTCPKKADGSAPCPDVYGCTKQNVVKTMNVKAGQLIGYSGNIGNSTGPHLHVEIHYQGGSCISNLNSAFGL